MNPDDLIKAEFQVAFDIEAYLNEINFKNIGFGKIEECIVLAKCKKCKYENNLTIKKKKEDVQE